MQDTSKGVKLSHDLLPARSREEVEWYSCDDCVNDASLPPKSIVLRGV